LGRGHWPQAEGVLPLDHRTGFMSYEDRGVDVHHFPQGTNPFLPNAAAGTIYSVGGEDGQSQVDQGSYGHSEVPVTCYDMLSVLGSFDPAAPAYVNVGAGTYGPNFQLQQGMPAPPPDGLTAPSWVTVSNDMAAASGSGVSGPSHSQNPSTRESAAPPTHYWTSYDPEGGY
jgi:hypothetical protein